MTVRGVRGAITAHEHSKESVVEATTELINAVVSANGIDSDDIAAAVFTTSPDLVDEFPASAARALGWEHVPLLDAQEMAVPHGQPRCIRILILWNTDKQQSEIKHIYLRDAHDLRQRGAGAS